MTPDQRRKFDRLLWLDRLNARLLPLTLLALAVGIGLVCLHIKENPQLSQRVLLAMTLVKQFSLLLAVVVTIVLTALGHRKLAARWFWGRGKGQVIDDGD